jgi:threonine/homoserine/homoserine lactone efflux protein
MDTQWLISIIGFAIVSLFSPGPNNLMVMSSGLNFGYKRSLPHVFGVVFGFNFMVLLVGSVLSKVFDIFPFLPSVLKVVCFIYLFYLAYKIATSAGPSDQSNKSSKPMSFTEAVLFQWVNPKAWTMALSAAGIYAADGNFTSVLLMTSVFFSVGIPSIFTWLFMGRKIGSLLKSQRQLRTFNYTMAVLLVLSVSSSLLQ